MGQGRQLGGEDDAAELSPVPIGQVRLWLSVIACNPEDLWRRLVLPTRIDEWSLASLQQRPVEGG